MLQHEATKRHNVTTSAHKTTTTKEKKNETQNKTKRHKVTSKRQKQLQNDANKQQPGDTKILQRDVSRLHRFIFYHRQTASRKTK